MIGIHYLLCLVDGNVCPETFGKEREEIRKVIQSRFASIVELTASTTRVDKQVLKVRKCLSRNFYGRTRGN